MLVAEPRSLLKTLNSTCTRALEGAASACVAARHYEVTVEHVLVALLDDLESDVHRILEHYEIDPAHLRAAIQRYLGDLRSGNAGKPTFGSLLFELFQDSWIYASTELGEAKVRSGALLVRLAMAPSRYLPFELPGAREDRARRAAQEPSDDRRRKRRGRLGPCSRRGRRTRGRGSEHRRGEDRERGGDGPRRTRGASRPLHHGPHAAREGERPRPRLRARAGDPQPGRHPRPPAQEQPHHRRRSRRRKDGARRGARPGDRRGQRPRRS